MSVFSNSITRLTYQTRFQDVSLLCKLKPKTDSQDGTFRVPDSGARLSLTAAVGGVGASARTLVLSSANTHFDKNSRDETLVWPSSIAV